MTNRIISREGLALSRRNFTRGALASAGLVLGGGALAQSALAPTPESPMGPFYPVDRLADHDADLTRIMGRDGRALGTVIELTGRVLDTSGHPVAGAQIEMWQCNAAGRYAHENDISTAPLDPNFQGFALLRADATGAWRITTVKPSGYDSPIGHRPPHLHFDIQGRRDRRVAQMYFPEDEAANAVDQLYRALGEQGPGSVAARNAGDAAKYSWDIILADA